MDKKEEVSWFVYEFGALAAATAIMFAACGGAASPSPSASSPGASATAAGSASAEPSASASAAIKEGGSIVVGLPGDMVLADPSLVSDSNSSYIQLNVVEGLLGIKAGTLSDIEPVLAESVPTPSADGLTYTFKLRTGIKFHDGTDFNADAVVYNYTRQKNAPKALQDAYNYYFGAVFGWGDYSNLASITAVDPRPSSSSSRSPSRTSSSPRPPCRSSGSRARRHSRQGDADNPDPSKSPYAQGQGNGMVGTGPFKFKSWTPRRQRHDREECGLLEQGSRSAPRRR